MWDQIILIFYSQLGSSVQDSWMVKIMLKLDICQQA